MPIANCILTKQCRERSGNEGDLLALWAGESSTSEAHMTINLITSSEQIGNKYSIMATLLVPSMWSSTGVSSLQLGLARALAQHFQLAASDVHVVTTVVSSGMVVEAGKEVEW